MAIPLNGNQNWNPLKIRKGLSSLIECEHVFNRGIENCVKCGISPWQAECKDLRAKLNSTYKIIESLTPGGSEFYHDPQRCVDFVNGSLESRMNIIRMNTKRYKELEAKLESDKSKHIEQLKNSGMWLFEAEKQRDEYKAKLEVAEKFKSVLFGAIKKRDKQIKEYKLKDKF
jgi:hypothetical protein